MSKDKEYVTSKDSASRLIALNSEVQAATAVDSKGHTERSIFTENLNATHAEHLVRDVRVSAGNPSEVVVASGKGATWPPSAPYSAESEAKLHVESKVGEAIIGAVDRAIASSPEDKYGIQRLNSKEASQLNNLRAYIANHSTDGVLDASEQSTIIARANNVAPNKGGHGR